MATDLQTAAVQKLYISYFSRPADAAGLDYWKGALAANPDAGHDMARQFSLSQEYRDMYTGLDARAMVTATYDKLFGRAAEMAGVDYWAGLLETSQVSIDNMVTRIADGAQGNDKIAFRARWEAAAVFTERLDLPEEKSAYSGVAANKIASDWIATIKDLQTGAMAQDVGVVDGVIAQIVGAGTTGLDTTGIFN
ncbi:DUF4214 domain-containing protein [Massilia sp. H6]|uniref:DUF4214 domain-containing protein n=1 Tax=Massilia sp. H6 TaxID=2970464 RepID=UPI002167B0AE|nr:DUF4214 domain-containing protein [Massilia sp. H6]UVW28131.1 DUF4214 domain-containing protein [Massilia sp. H6]